MAKPVNMILCMWDISNVMLLAASGSEYIYIYIYIYIQLAKVFVFRLGFQTKIANGHGKESHPVMKSFL